MVCGIRKWSIEDAPALARIINNKNIQKNLRDGLPYPYSEADAEYFIGSVLNSDFAFAVTADGVLAGSISVERGGNVHSRTGELGYYIGEEFWGMGIGSEAVRLICRHVFENSDIIRIFAEPFSYNSASCRVLEKNGFVYEGTLRKNAVKDGKVLDMKMYALIKGNC